MSVPSRTSLLAAASVGAVAFVFAFHQIYDPDFWFHLATGRWILANGRIPTADPFSFATPGAPWVPHYWLPAIGMTLVWGKWGAAGIIVVKALIVATGFALAVLLAVRVGVHPWLAALVLAAAVPVTHFEFQERPHVLMFVLVPAFYWLLAAPGAERRARTWALVPALTLVWVNLHASFLFAIGFAGLLALDRIAGAVAARVRGEAPDVLGAVLACALTVALALVTLATPFGLALPRLVVNDLSNHALTRAAAIEEYRAIVWSEHPGFAALVVATGLGFVAAWRRPRSYVLVAYAAMVWMAAHSVRFVGAAGILLAGILAWNLQPIVAALGTRRRSPPRWVTTSAAIGTMAIFAAVAFRSSFVTGGEERFGVGVNESRFPTAAVRFLNDGRFEGNLFNGWEFGGYLLWHLPGAKLVMDGRALEAHIALKQRIDAMDAGALSRWLAEHDVKGVLLGRQDRIVAFFPGYPQYVRAFFDDRGVVFLRNDVAVGASRGAAAYRFIRPEELDPSYLVPLAQGPDAAAAENELRRAAAAAPDAFQPRFLLAVFLEARGGPEALDHYLAAARLSPGLAFAHYQLGERAGALALRTGREAVVEPLLRQALEIRRGDPHLQALLATSLYVQRKLPEAEELFRRALAGAPELELALSNLGYLYVDTSRARLAVPLFARARRVAPASENAAYGLAYALAASGDRAGAAAAWKEFLAAFPTSRWTEKARAKLAAAEAR